VALAHLPNLYYLDLSHNKLRDLPDDITRVKVCITSTPTLVQSAPRSAEVLEEEEQKWMDKVRGDGLEDYGEEQGDGEDVDAFLQEMGLESPNKSGSQDPLSEGKTSQKQVSIAEDVMVHGEATKEQESEGDTEAEPNETQVNLDDVQPDQRSTESSPDLAQDVTMLGFQRLHYLCLARNNLNTPHAFQLLSQLPWYALI
jgi:Leucine-rich repeat (LRR) protein